MVKIPEFMLTTAIEVTPYLGSGAYGPMWGDPFNIRGRVQPESRLIRDSDGAEVVASGRLFLAPDVALQTQSTVFIDGIEYDVIRVSPQYGPNGERSHLEVWLR